MSLTFQAAPALAQPGADGPDAGEEPSGGPIVYNLVPEEGSVVSEEELGSLRAGATIETQHDGGIRSAEMSLDGQRMPDPSLGGPYSYLQSVSYGIGDLEPGKHTVEVTATDTQGRTGGHEWTFTVEKTAAATNEPDPSPAEGSPAEESIVEESTVEEEPATQETLEQPGAVLEGDGAAAEHSSPPDAEIERLPDTGGVPLLSATVAAAVLMALGALGIAGSRRRRNW